MSLARFKPVSVAAFALTLMALLLTQVSFWLPRWFALSSQGSSVRHWHGLWHQQRCSDRGCGETSVFNRIEGGKEFYFISKVFATMASVLLVPAFLLHCIYAFLRKPLLRQVAIYLLCGAGLFGVLASLIFVAKSGWMREYPAQEVSLGPCFPLALIGGLLCLLASAVTAWATYNKANYDDDDEDMAKDITKDEMNFAQMDD